MTTKGKTALPKDWEPSEALRAWARINARDIDFHGTLQEFRDYSHGKDWRMADWDATFRNWLRKGAKAAKGKHMMAGAEKPAPARDTPMAESKQPDTYKAMLNLAMLKMLMHMKGTSLDKLRAAGRGRNEIAAEMRSMWGENANNAELADLSAGYLAKLKGALR